MSDCETSKDQDEMQDQLRSTYKRRSSVFQLGARRLEEAQMTINIDDDEEKNGHRECDAIVSSEAFDLPAYIEKLRNERKEWKETLNVRKSRRRNLQKQKAIVEKHGTDFDLNVLSESDRSFVLERPNYQQICRNIKSLTDAAVKVAALDREIEVLNDRLTLKIEQKVLNATKKIMEMSSD